MLSEEQRNGGSTIGSSQESTFYSNQSKGEVEEKAVLVAVQQIRTNINNRKTNPMEEDVVTLEAGGVKEDEVHGKGINK